MNTIDFYFDFSSPYGYLASERIEKIAQTHEHRVVWHPILLGAVFKITGQNPLTETPLKGEYSIMDFARSAREHSLPFQFPEKFPIAGVAASRAVLWLRDHSDVAMREKTGDLVHGIYRAYFQLGQDITHVDTLADVASALEIDTQTMLKAITEQSIKDALRQEVDSAISNSIFGSPLMIVNGEKFWGHDRLEQLDHWIQSGGW